jgi:hypothetical protein
VTAPPLQHFLGYGGQGRGFGDEILIGVGTLIGDETLIGGETLGERAGQHEWQ